MAEPGPDPDTVERWNVAIWEDGTIAGIYPAAGLLQPVARSDMRIIEVVPASALADALAENERLEAELQAHRQAALKHGTRLNLAEAKLDRLASPDDGLVEAVEKARHRSARGILRAAATYLKGGKDGQAQ
jgi:hypothetical protein